MWTQFKDWLHHALDPHCMSCALVTEENKRCKNCELYREQLDLSNREKAKLLEIIVTHAYPQPVAEVEAPDFQPINTSRFKPWSVKQRELEAQERQAANKAREKAASPDPEIEKLEDLILDEKVVGSL